MFDVTTLRLPPRSGAATGSHCAIDSPCHVGFVFADDAGAPKRKRRVCVPASVSMRSVLASCHVMCSRVGTFMIAPTPYDLHWFPARVSAAGSHALMIGTAAGETGMRRYS